jgi:hypothetical protein
MRGLPPSPMHRLCARAARMAAKINTCMGWEADGSRRAVSPCQPGRARAQTAVPSIPPAAAMRVRCRCVAPAHAPEPPCWALPGLRMRGCMPCSVGCMRRWLHVIPRRHGRSGRRGRPMRTAAAAACRTETRPMVSSAYRGMPPPCRQAWVGPGVDVGSPGMAVRMVWVTHCSKHARDILAG